MKRNITKKGWCLATILFLVGVCAIPSISGENLEKSYSIPGGTNPATQNVNGVSCGYEEIIIAKKDSGLIGIYRKTPGNTLLEEGFFDGDYWNMNLFTCGAVRSNTLDYIITGIPLYHMNGIINLYFWNGTIDWWDFTIEFHDEDDLYCGDVDGDTYDELILTEYLDSKKVYIYEVTSVDLWECNTFYTYIMKVVGCGDLDGDGTDEILIYDGQNFRLINKDGSGNTYIYTNNNVWDECAIGDLDADGKDELILVDTGLDTIEIWNEKSSMENDFICNYDLPDNIQVHCGKFDWNFKEHIVISDSVHDILIFADFDGDQYHIDYEFEEGDSFRCGDFVLDYPTILEDISGPNNIIPNLKVKYSTKAYTPNRYDKLWYRFDWDDGKDTWIGPCNSGEEAVASHAWEKSGYYTIRVWVENFYYQNPYDAWKTIKVIKSKQSIELLFIEYLQTHPNLFPILRRVLQKLNL